MPMRLSRRFDIILCLSGAAARRRRAASLTPLGRLMSVIFARRSILLRAISGSLFQDIITFADDIFELSAGYKGRN